MESVIRRPTASPSSARPARLEPTRVKVSGPLHGVIFPEACVRCGAPARDTLCVDKMFRHAHSESPTTYELARLRRSMPAASGTPRRPARGARAGCAR